MDNDLDGLPSHIVQKSKERIQKALKKNASLDTESLGTIDGMLEYTDLRELQDVIASKNLWQRFESIFASKGVLTSKFDQLAELRNGIRHSRTVDSITAKEGEASILWFEQILPNNQ